MKAFHEIRNYASDFMVWHSNYTNISFLAHWHNEIELIYVRSGTARISITDQSFTASAGDLIVCDSGNIHYSDSYDAENSLDFIVFDPGIISSFYQNSHFAHPLVTSAQLMEYGLAEPLENLMDTVGHELMEKAPYYQDIVKASMRSFWYLLKRKLPKSNSDMQSQSRRQSMFYDLQQLLSYLDEHYADNITLAFAASKMNFSDSHFSKVFKKLTGINFVTYLNMVRIEQAARQLHKTPQKITDIALNCGFSNIRTFNRVFKEITGHTPSSFSSLPDGETGLFDNYRQKSSEQKFVENDSLTVIKNIERWCE